LLNMSTLHLLDNNSDSDDDDMPSLEPPSVEELMYHESDLIFFANGYNPFVAPDIHNDDSDLEHSIDSDTATCLHSPLDNNDGTDGDTVSHYETHAELVLQNDNDDDIVHDHNEHPENLGECDRIIGNKVPLSRRLLHYHNFSAVNDDIDNANTDCEFPPEIIESKPRTNQIGGQITD